MRLYRSLKETTMTDTELIAELQRQLAEAGRSIESLAEESPTLVAEFTERNGDIEHSWRIEGPDATFEKLMAAVHEWRAGRQNG